MAEIVTLSIKDFRAVKEADIKLNGITVVTGVNGCGKSTLSKFLYYTFHIANTYEDVVAEELASRLSDIAHFIEILQREVASLMRVLESTEYQKTYYIYRQTHIRLSEEEGMLALLHKLESDYTNLIKRIPPDANTGLQRIINILRNILSLPDVNSTLDFSELMSLLYEHVKKAFASSADLLNKRPVGVLKDALSDVFINSALPKEFEICEYGDLVIGDKSKTVSVIHSVQKVAYIDTPMILGVTTLGQNYWHRLNDILKGFPRKDFNSRIDNILHSEILQGESNYDEGERTIDDKFIFKHDNGSIYNLLECATGIKAFSILQMMLRSGFLTSNTLLIIDEPEVHLHPQWIVEYARLIVLLNKYVGVSFFIASHNPDMVSAIKYISEKENVDSSLNFYLAELADSEKFLYIYRDLGTDINAIFKSFNIALDRIGMYGVAKEGQDDLF